jgi:hypothetical protein
MGMKISLDTDIRLSILRVCSLGVFYPRFSYLGNFAQIAQSVEHILGKDEVTGSIPVLGLLKIFLVRFTNGQGEI